MPDVDAVVKTCVAVVTATEALRYIFERGDREPDVEQVKAILRDQEAAAARLTREVTIPA